MHPQLQLVIFQDTLLDETVKRVCIFLWLHPAKPIIFVIF